MLFPTNPTRTANSFMIGVSRLIAMRASGSMPKGESFWTGVLLLSFLMPNKTKFPISIRHALMERTATTLLDMVCSRFGTEEEAHSTSERILGSRTGRKALDEPHLE